jgi:uncharacterized membrane protein
MSDGNQRRGYLDWMRGLAVLVMIEAHTLDSWTRLDARDAWQFQWAMIVAGFGAPLFLFLAGTTATLSAGSKFRRSGDARAASRAVVWRGFWVCCLAFLFRVQAWVLALAPARSLLGSTSSISWDRRSWPPARSGGPSARRARGARHWPRRRWPSRC